MIQAEKNLSSSPESVNGNPFIRVMPDHENSLVRKNLIAHSRLLQLLKYDRATGKFLRLRTGKGANSTRLKLDGFSYLPHRIAWFYVNGEWPTGIIDHKDGDDRNNAFDNLRDTDYLGNNTNTPKHRDGYLTGTTYDSSARRIKRWRARVKIDGKSRNLGYFMTQDEAHERYLAELTTLRALP